MAFPIPSMNAKNITCQIFILSVNTKVATESAEIPAVKLVIIRTFLLLNLSAIFPPEILKKSIGANCREVTIPR